MSSSAAAFGTQADDLTMSIRFKHGIHTLFLFVQPDSKFAAIRAELLSALQDRYPDGLRLAPDGEESENAPLPDDPDQIALGVPKNAADLAEGWKTLSVKAGDSAAAKGFKDGTVVAFRFLGEEGEDAGAGGFSVTVPVFEEVEVEGEADADMEGDGDGEVEGEGEDVE